MSPIPEGFVDEMKTLLGENEALLLAKALDDEPSTSIRLNRRKVKSLEALMERFGDYGPSPVEWCRSGFYLERRPDFVHDPLLHAGAYYVQEAASMVYETIVEQLVASEGFAADCEGKVRVLDMCAAPGGKSTAILNGLASLPSDRYMLIANEYDRKRARILKENLDKWGDPNVTVTNSPGASFGEMEDSFDIVAVDAPCSGEGMMRREPVARTQWSPKLVEQCAALQREILENAVRCLRPGGYLIYSTCTFNDKENEGNANWVAETFGLESVGEPCHFMPHRALCEGLFVAVFRKPEKPYTRREPCVKNLRVLSSGTEQTVNKGSIEIPSSRQTLAYDYDRTKYPEVELTREEALAYLRRNPLRLPEDTPLGYVCVAYEGYPLGLVKNVGNRANNLYPAEWRILT